MTSGGIEDSFSRIESAASELRRRLKLVDRAAAKLERAGRTGEVATVRRSVGELESLKSELDAALSEAGSLSLSDSALSSMLRDDFLDEMLRASAEAGLAMNELDGRLISFPVVIEIQPESLAVKIGRKTIRSIRPSALVPIVRSLAERQASKPERFIELLHRAATWVNEQNVSTIGVRLEDVYEVLTLHPEAKKSYSRTDFAVDLYTLETSGVTRTKSGAVVSFVGSTGAKGAKSFTIVGNDSRPRNYVGVRFEEKR